MSAKPRLTCHMGLWYCGSAHAFAVGPTFQTAYERWVWHLQSVVERRRGPR